MILEFHKINTFFWLVFFLNIFFQYSNTVICANFPKTFLYFRITQIQHFSKFLDFTKSTLFSDLYFFSTFFKISTKYTFICANFPKTFLYFRITQIQHFSTLLDFTKLTCIFSKYSTILIHLYVQTFQKHFFILELHKFNTFLNFWISQNQHFSLTCIFF